MTKAERKLLILVAKALCRVLAYTPLTPAGNERSDEMRYKIFELMEKVK